MYAYKAGSKSHWHWHPCAAQYRSACPPGWIHHSDAGDTVDLLISYQLGDLLDQPRLVYHIGKLCHDDPALSVCHRSQYLSPPAHGSFPGRYGKPPQFRWCPRIIRSCGKIRSLYDLQNFLDGGIPVLLNLIVNDLDHRTDHFPQIVRRNVGGHTDGDTGGSVYQQIRKTGWEALPAPSPSHQSSA